MHPSRLAQVSFVAPVLQEREPRDRERDPYARAPLPPPPPFAYGERERVTTPPGAGMGLPPRELRDYAALAPPQSPYERPPVPHSPYERAPPPPSSAHLRDPRDRRERDPREREWEDAREREWAAKHALPAPTAMVPPPLPGGPPLGHPDRARWEHQERLNMEHHARLERERGRGLPPPLPPHAHAPPPPHLHMHGVPPPHIAPPPPHHHIPPHALQSPHGLPPPPPPSHVIPPAALPMPTPPVTALPLPPLPASLPMPPPPHLRAAAPRALPMPPPPPADALTGAGSAPAAAWRIYKTAPPDSRDYYFNTMTERAQWNRPIELIPEHERELPPCEWTEHKTEDGISYFAHTATGVSVWSRPPELVAWEEAKRARDEYLAKKRAENPPPAAAETPAPEPDSNSNLSQARFKETQAKLLAAKKTKKKDAAATGATAAGATSENVTSPSAAPAASPEAAAATGEGGAAPASAAAEAEPGEVMDESNAAGNAAATAAADAAAAAAAVVENDPVYATKQEARAAFRQLLVDARITPRMTNFATEVQPLIERDVRYRALKTLPEKKKAYLSYLEEVVKQEQDARRAREQHFLDQFNALLVETIEIDARSRFKTSLPLLQQDERFRGLHAFYMGERMQAGHQHVQINLDAVHTKLENIFYKHVDALLARDKAAAAAKRLAQAEALKQLLREQTEIDALEADAPERDPSHAEEKEEGEEEEGELGAEAGAVAAEALPVRPAAPRWITANTTFRHLKKRSEFTSDPRWLDGLAEADAFEVFEAWQAKLAKIAREKEQAAKEARRAQEKQKRKDFRLLLSEEVEKGNLHGRSRWKEVLPLLQDDARYTDLVEWYMQPSDGAASRDKAAALDKVKDLFADFVAELAERLEPIKKTLKNALVKDLHVTILPNHTPAQLTRLAETHPKWSALTAEMSALDITAVWRELIAKQLAKQHYFHSRQKAEQIKLVTKMLRTLHAERSTAGANKAQKLAEAQAITFDAIKQQVHELQQPVAVAAPPVELEEGETEEEGELPAPVELVPRQHPPVIAEGIAAWKLLECPPIPPPGADPAAPAPAIADGAPAPAPYTTDDYTREAVDAFKTQLLADIAAGVSIIARDEDERKSGSGKSDAARKRRRSASASRSPSRADAKKGAESTSRRSSDSPSRSQAKRAREDDEAKRPNGTSSAPASSDAMEDGEL